MEMPMFISFVLATALMIALPGPSVLLTVAHSITFGWRRAMVTVFGATLGIAAQLFVAVLGIGSLVALVAATFDLLRWAGAAYLIYVGVKVWCNAGRMVGLGDAASGRSNSLLMQGLVITVCNPKSLLFIVAFLPQFIDIRRPIAMQFMIIIPVFLLITFAVTAGWALVSGWLNGRVRDPARLAIVFRAAAAMIMLSGAGMAMMRSRG